MKKLSMRLLIPLVAFAALMMIVQTNMFSFALTEPADGDVTVFLGQDMPVVGQLFNRDDEEMRWYPGFEGRNSIFLKNLSGNSVRLNWARAAVSGVYEMAEDGSRGLERSDLNEVVGEAYSLRLSDGETIYYEGLLKDFITQRAISEIIPGNDENRVLDVELKLLETAEDRLENLIIDLSFEFDFDEIVVAADSGGGAPLRGGSGGGSATETILDEEIALAPGGGHWSDEAVDHLYDIDVLDIIPGAILPDAPINRAEAGTTIVRLLGYEGEEGLENTYYLDTLPTYAQDYLIEGTELGVLEGYPDGYYRPYDPVTREEFAAMIARAFDLQGDPEALSYYQDYDSFRGTWGLAHLGGMHGMGYYIGYEDQTLRPKDYLSNGEAYTVLYRISMKMEGEQ